MTQAEKLEALVRKAIDGGWRYLFQGSRTDIHYYDGHISVITDSFAITYYDAATIIFNHDFARALFGDKEGQYWYPECETVAPNNESKQTELCWQESWRYHLQMMVLSEDPIGYMYKEVFGERP